MNRFGHWKSLKLASFRFKKRVVCGFCSAYLMKTVGRMLAIAVGAVFLGLQVRQTRRVFLVACVASVQTVVCASLCSQGLQHAGYITINWAKANKTFVDKLDQNGDGFVCCASVFPVVIRPLPQQQTRSGRLVGGEISLFRDRDERHSWRSRIRLWLHNRTVLRVKSNN